MDKTDKTSQRRHLLARLAAERAALLAGLLGMDEPTLTERLVFGDWTVKDILAHIAAWDRWEERTMRTIIAGETPDLSALMDFAVSNAAFVADWRDRSLDDVMAEVVAARSEWADWLKRVPDEEFFFPRSYYGHEWTFSKIPMQVQWQHDAEHAGQIVNWRSDEAPEGATGTLPVLLAALDAAREELLTAVALVPAGERRSRLVCGEWSLKDVLGHIADWEWYGVGGLRQMAAGQPPHAEPIGDLDTWNASQVLARRQQPWEAVWNDLRAARQTLLGILQGMSQSTLTRSFPFPWGSEGTPYHGTPYHGTPYQWMHIFVDHDHDHARDLRDNVVEQS